MVFHDPDITIDRQKISLENSSSAILKNYPLKNGETMPSFDQYLATLKQCRTTRLIIELKSIALTEARQTELARKTLDKVRQAGLEDRVEYIAFSLYLCQELHRLDPQAQVAYLNGDLSPRQIKKRGLTGLDYHMDVFRSHPRWIRQARKLGLRTNVWTVNETDDLRYFIDQQVDYISTDQPERLQRLLKERLSQ